MAPVRDSSGLGTRNKGAGGSNTKKSRKPVGEKKRRARINESLQELRLLITEAEMKREPAEVLEMTGRRQESILQSKAQELEALNRDNHEHFAAGYIQCMHDMHTFMSNCPGIEPLVATELFSYLLESMPLNQNQLQFMVPDSMAEHFDCSLNESLFSESPGASTVSSDDFCLELDQNESEQSHGLSSEQLDALCLSFYTSKPMFRPW